MKTPLRKLREWLKVRGYTLTLKKGLEWQVRFSKKMVTGDPSKVICRKKPLNRTDKIAILLHECGHIERRQFVRPIPTPWTSDLRCVPVKAGEKPSASWYIAMVQEEVDAWNAGYALAQRLEISGIDRAMARMRRICLMSYMKWAARKGDHTPHYPK